MAWNVDYIKVGDDYTYYDYSATAPLTWGTFSVFVFKFKDPVTTISFELERDSTNTDAYAYFCTSPTDYMNADTEPTNYITRFSFGGTKEFSLDDLQADYGTSTLHVVIRPRYSSSEGSCTLHVMVDTGGGGTTTEPTFTAEPYGSDGIRVVVSDPSGVITDERCRVMVNGSVDGQIYLYSSSEWLGTGYSSGTYTITVDYMADGSWYSMLYDGGGLEASVDVGGGGGGGGVWDLDPEDLGTVTSQIYTYRHYKPYTLYRFTAQFDKSGTVTFYSALSTTDTAADPKGWITNHVSTYNSDTGEPPPSATIYADGDDNGDQSKQFKITYDGIQAGVPYDFWFRLYDGSLERYGYIGIDPPAGSADTWTESYAGDIVVSDSTRDYTLTLQPYITYRFRVQFPRNGVPRIYSSGATSDVDVIAYFTTKDYEINPADGIPIVPSGDTCYTWDDSGSGNANFDTDTEADNNKPNVTGGAWYHLWVKLYNSDKYPGGVTIYISPPPEDTSWTEVDMGKITLQTSGVTEPLEIESRHTYKYRLTFSTSGTARFWSTGSINDIAYIGTTDGGISPEEGYPMSYNGWGDNTSDTDKNYNFTFEVKAGVTYYFWVKGINSVVSGGIAMAFVPPADTGKVWIHNGSGWIQATPWIYTGSGWVRAAPWVYTSDGWKKCR